MSLNLALFKLSLFVEVKKLFFHIRILFNSKMVYLGILWYIFFKFDSKYINTLFIVLKKVIFHLSSVK